MFADDVSDDSDEVVITPFQHQVGGHKVVLQISKHLICKPREEYEIEFYKRLPENLKDCVPHFRGNVLGLDLDWCKVFNATFSNISVISWRSIYRWRKPEYGENHRPVASH